MNAEVQQEIGTSVVDLIGHTPLLRLRKFERDCPGVEVYAKAEWQNPGGSVKDRPAARMIAEGERKGTLTPDKVILDATSGNTGIAYAMIGAARGYRVRLCVPSNVTPERKQILGTYGAELIYTDPMDGSDGAIREARRLYAEAPDRYFYPDQYNNDGNWQAHYETTGEEIIAQTNGRVTHFVAGLGTSGTFVGCRPAAAGVRARTEPTDRAGVGAAGLAVAWSRRVKAYGHGDRPWHLRSLVGQRGSTDRHRGGL